MNASEIRTSFLAAIDAVAPGEDLDSIDDQTRYREEFELDSMDFLDLLAQVHERLGVEVPETDYAQFDTVGGAVAYLTEHIDN